MEKKLTKGGGASHGIECPDCGLPVANVAQSGNFGAYKAMPQSGAGSRSNPPLENWLFYGEMGKRYPICSGDWGKHYHTGVMQLDKDRRPTGRHADFLWLKGAGIGQRKMEL